MSSLVSIIVLCYNREKVIRRSLESILNQTYDNIECIVVNDGSTDKSLEIINSMKSEFESRHYELKIISSENRGAAGATAGALKFISGKYVSMLDSDDVFLPESIELRAEFLDNNADCSMVISDGYKVREDDIENVIEKFSDSVDTDIFGNDYFTNVLLSKAYTWSGSYMLRSDILLDYYSSHNFILSRFGQNLQMVLPVAYKNKCGFISKPLMKYIFQNQSLSVIGNIPKGADIEVNNYIGYRDIRLGLVDDIIDDENVRESLKKQIIVHTARLSLRQYRVDKMFKKAKEQYRILCDYDSNTVDDKVELMSIKSELLARLCRVLKIK